MANDRPLSRAGLAHVQARVTRAIWRRLAEQDRGHVEHRLQGALALGPLQTALRLAEFAREYPAWRGDHRPGFIDFLGLDWQNRLHVVETKVNPDDVTAVLQALDYVIWVQANATKIRDERRRWPESRGEEKSVVCDFVLRSPDHASTGRIPCPFRLCDRQVPGRPARGDLAVRSEEDLARPGPSC